MTLAEAIALFLGSPSNQHACYPRKSTLNLLERFFSAQATVSDLTPERLRDFLARWCVENAFPPNRRSPEADPFDASAEAGAEIDRDLDPSKTLDALEEFLSWSDRKTGTDASVAATPLLRELRRSLPKALEITKRLSTSLQQRGGAFSFPEFLTSFEEGGHSQYDIDSPGTSGALEGYFRINRVEGSLVDANELITGERVWPVIFPAEVASMIDDRYIINLELVPAREAWHITECGFCYPPETEI